MDDQEVSNTLKRVFERIVEHDSQIEMLSKMLAETAVAQNFSFGVMQERCDILEKRMEKIRKAIFYLADPRGGHTKKDTSNEIEHLLNN